MNKSKFFYGSPESAGNIFFRKIFLKNPRFDLLKKGGGKP